MGHQTPARLDPASIDMIASGLLLLGLALGHTAPEPPRRSAAPAAVEQEEGQAAGEALDRALEGDDDVAAVRALQAVAAGTVRPTAKLIALCIRNLGSEAPLRVEAALDAIEAVGPRALPLLQTTLDEGAIGQRPVPAHAAARALLRLGTRGEAQLLARTQEAPVDPALLDALSGDAAPRVALRELCRIAAADDDPGWALWSLDALRKRAGRNADALREKNVRAATKALDPALRDAVRGVVLGVSADERAERIRDGLAGGSDAAIAAALLEVPRGAPELRSASLTRAVLAHVEHPSDGVRAAAFDALAWCSPLRPLKPHESDNARRPRGLLGIGGRGPAWRRLHALLEDAPDGVLRSAPEPDEPRRRVRAKPLDPLERSDAWALAPTWFEPAGIPRAPREASGRPPLRLRALRPEEHAPLLGAFRRAAGEISSEQPALARAAARCLVRWSVRDTRVVHAAWRALNPSEEPERRWRTDHEEAYLWTHLDLLGERIEALPTSCRLSAAGLELLVATADAGAEALAADLLAQDALRWTEDHFAAVAGHDWGAEARATLDAHALRALASGRLLHAARVVPLGPAALPTLRTMLGDERVDVRMVAVAALTELDGGKDLVL
ncbi:MAG: hypothetical protein AAFP22_05530, partial [Planctomycetota bacterium]